RVTVADIQQAGSREQGEPLRSEESPVDKGPPPPAGAEKAPDGRRLTREPMSPLRQRIAARLLAARQQTALLTTFNEADLGTLKGLRTRHQAQFTQNHGVKLGLMSFFVKATVEALKAYPMVNARIDGNDIVYHHYFDIGIAVGTERGLVVPVLRDADRLTFAEIEQTISELAQKAVARKLTLAELEGGTFTISNGGIYGSLLSTPLLNPPQTGVLGTHAVQDRPVARDGEVVIRPMMYLALSYDHRLIDGREAVGFLKLIKEYLEDPEQLLLEL
ncbi:MAG: dihydrolipoyllysine-residue succinyltransferase, partial [Gemmatimonadales bacterium]